MKTNRKNLNTDSLRLNGQLFKFEVYEEDQITWEQHIEIHKALNLCFSGRTKSFIKKTYAHITPVKRVLCTVDGAIVGHIAVFEDYTTVNNRRILIAGLGMNVSLKPMSLIGAILRKKALSICAERRHTFAIGRVRNNPRIRKHLSSFVWCFLDVPLIGKTTKSHTTEILAIFNTDFVKNCPDELLNHFKKIGVVQIEDEVF